jgi:hypothetical protein
VGSTRLLTIGVALVATLAGSAPAAAAPPPPKTEIVTDMRFQAGPAETTPGGRVVLSGWAGIVGRDTGNAGKVDFYFHGKKPQDKEVYVGSTEAGSSGKFRYTTKATVSGQYRAKYQHRTRDITADGTWGLNVYVDRHVDHFLYSWTADALSCLPACVAEGPDQFVSAGPIKVELTRQCLQPRSGGRIGFTDDDTNTYKAGAPGWRDFPEGEGPTEFELKPGITLGHFYLEWTSAPPAGDKELTSCNLSFSASQKRVQREYV